MLPLLSSCSFREFPGRKSVTCFWKEPSTVEEETKFYTGGTAYESGISLSQIARIETGKINPTLCTLTTIAKTLKIKAPDLLDF